jgi:hypothetical protein
LDFDNGDAKAFDEIKEKWGFVDDASLLRFAMAAMLSSVDNTLSITGENGDVRKIQPADSFTKKIKNYSSETVYQKYIYVHECKCN